MRIFLNCKGLLLSKTTVHKYMNKEPELACICRRKRQGYKKGQAHKLFPNLLQQDFDIHHKNRVWCSDFTYLKLANGSFRYNCSIIRLIFLILLSITLLYTGCNGEEDPTADPSYLGFLEVAEFTNWSYEIANIIEMRAKSDTELRAEGLDQEAIDNMRAFDLDAAIKE